MPTILVVDDEPMLRSMIEFALRLEGLPVIETGSAEEALSIVRSSPGEIDLLIVEVQLPGTSGPELAAELLAEDPAMRVLLVSGSLESLPPEVSRRFEFLAKPFPLNSFVRHVRRLLQLVAEPTHT